MNSNFVSEMMKAVFLTCFVFLGGISLLGQEYNVVDDQGRKQGEWRKFYEESTAVFYKGQFKDDIPIGRFIYYYRDGSQKGIMDYKKDGFVFNQTFYPKTGKLMAQGLYIDQKKDSVWNYYSESGRLTSTEEWDKGAKHGVEKVFFEDGELAELTTHVDGLRSGVWEQYYDNQQTKVSGSFVRDQLEGSINYYFENGAKEITGKFLNGYREGTWMYFNKDGSIRYQAVYRGGEIVKEKKENGVFEERGPDDILLSSYTYENGLKEGPYAIYHDEFEYEYEEVVDKLTGDSYFRQVLIGNELKEEGIYRNDQLHGEVKIYNEKGILIERKNYVEGELK
ncbi:MAG: hypothetical protein HKN45_08850 [Flavobacteriales bacterium]|nr:hypothetical protein [Flavobacteriales bacterium]